MIHQPYGQVGGQVSDIEIQAEEIVKSKQVINEILARHTGQPIERVSKDTERDRYLTAAQAKEYGLVDEVVGRIAGLEKGATCVSSCLLIFEKVTRIMPLVPIVIERSGREERAMDIYSRLLQDRIIILGSQIDDKVANLVVAQMLVLAHQDAKADIHLYVNSPGGSVTAGPGDLRHNAMGFRAMWRPTASASAPAWARCCLPPAPKASATPCPTAES